ncbi:MAG: GAF domain-containing protein [Chloroflexi bacterium]|nr:MAG: GAF domain-containing protein [Chloroflexota bacterium]
MYKSDAPYVTDWFVVSLRWFVLLVTTATLALGEDELVSIPSFLLILLMAWNVFLSWMAGTSRRFNRHRPINVAVDLGITALFYWMHGGAFGPAVWMVLLSVVSGAVYFDVYGGLGAAGAMALVEVADVFLNGTNILSAGILAAVTLVMGGFFGFLSKRTLDQFRVARLQIIAAREKKQRVENDRLRAIYNLTSTLAATLSYKRVLDSVLDLSVNALHVDDVTSDDVTPKDDRLVSAVMLFRGDELTIGSARRLTHADMRATFVAKEGLLQKAVDVGEPIVTGSIAADPELGRLMSLRYCNSIYCYPLRSGFSVYGVLIFGHPDEGYFTNDRCEVLAILARQAVIAIQNARLYQDIADEKERMVDVQEEARKKLARDLHDGPTQSVAAMAMRVNLARRMIERDPKMAMDELEKIEDLARRTTKEIRHMLFTLRPLVLESQGLTAALQAMADKMKETFGQQVVIQVEESLASQLEMGKSGVIFYIAEEAVNNARKHAQAPHVWVRLKPLAKQPDIAYLEIADDGLGFDVAAMNKAYDKRGSLGMINLRERTELVNGLLNIDSALGKGTRVQVYIPLTEESADLLHHARDREQD